MLELNNLLRLQLCVRTPTGLLRRARTPMSLPGMDFYVCLERRGYRVARRRARKSRVGVKHKVTKEDAIKW